MGAEARGSRQLALSRSSPTSLLPFSVHSHGSALPHGRGPQQGSQGDQERGQAKAQPPPRGEYQGARLVGRKPSRRRAGPRQSLPERRRSIESRGNPGVLSRGKKNVRLARGESGKAGYPPVCPPFLRTPTGATYRDPPPRAVDSEAGAGATWEPVLTHEQEFASRTVHGSGRGKVDSLIFVLRNRGLEGRTCVCVSWLSGANSTVPSLCAGRQCSGSRDCPWRAGRDALLWC